MLVVQILRTCMNSRVVLRYIIAHLQVALLVFLLHYNTLIFATEAPSQSTSALLATPSLSLKNSIIVDNTILASVRGHVITVYDLVKKLDMIFYRQFPEFRSSVEARLQFYRSNWRFILKDAIDRQLAIAYAEDKNFVVSNGDVREELEEIFGPNVMMNLYEAGLCSYDVQEMLKADILMRRLLSFFVRTPVMASITPQKVQALYNEREKKKSDKTSSLSGSSSDEWTWQAITITPKNHEEKLSYDASLYEISQEERDNIYNTLAVQKKETIQEAIAHFQQSYDIVLSQEFTSPRGAIAPHIIEAMAQVPQGQFSQPILAPARSGANSVWKMYRHIDTKESQEKDDFSSQEAALKEELATPLIAAKTTEFFAMLAQQYGVHYMVQEKEITTMDPFRLHQKTP